MESGKCKGLSLTTKPFENAATFNFELQTSTFPASPLPHLPLSSCTHPRSLRSRGRQDSNLPDRPNASSHNSVVRAGNPLIKRVERSRHCEFGQTAFTIAVESGADNERERHFTREQLDEMSRFRTIDIHTTRSIRTITFGLVGSDSLHSFPDADTPRPGNG